MSKFDTVITVNDEDGEEHDINVEIDYTDSPAEPDVGYNGGLEEFSFTKSEHSVFNVKWLNEKLDSDTMFADYVMCQIIEDMESREYDPPYETD